MGVTEEQLSDAQEQFRSQLEAMGGDISAIEMMFGGSTGESGDAGFGPTNEVPGPLDDISLDDLTIDDLPQPERGNPDSDTGEEERSGDEGDIEADEQG